MLTYSWIERSGSLPVEWFRQAAALDRSPLVRPAHMLAIRLSARLGPSASGIEAAEQRIRRAWLQLAPELVGYASTGRTRTASFGVVGAAGRTAHRRESRETPND